MAVFWVVTPCSLVEVYQRFRGPYCLHQGDEPLTAAKPQILHEKLGLFYPMFPLPVCEAAGVLFKADNSGPALCIYNSHSRTL
jgi:hypothetical protein